MKHAFLMTLVLSLCLPSSASGQSGPGQAVRDQGVARQKRARVRVSPVLAMLGKRVDYVGWDGAPFGEVLRWLRDQSTDYGKVNVAASWRALADAGVDTDTQVTLELQDVSVAEVLNEVLDQVSGADPLTYMARGNVLKITTRSALRRKQFTRVYNVAGLLAQFRGQRVTPRFAVQTQVGIARTNAVQGGGLGGTVEPLTLGTSMFGDPEDINSDDDDDDDETDEEIAQRLMDVIQATIEPDSWVVNGGRGAVVFLEGMLVVRNSADVHMQLGGAFDLSR